MNKLSNFLKRLGLGAIIIMTILMPLTACAADLTDTTTPTQNEMLGERGGVRGSPSVENTNAKMADFSKYPQVNEPLEDAKEDMFKVNLVKQDGTVVRIDKEFQNGIKVLKGRTAVSMFDITENISGIDLSWNQQDRVATAENEDNLLHYPINKRVMSRNGAIEELDVAATVDSKINRTYLPLRSLMESLGYDVEYHEPTKTIDILEKGAPKQDHKGEVAEKPSTGVDKPAGISGKKAEVVKDSKTEVDGKVVSRTVYYSLPQFEDMEDMGMTLGEHLKGKKRGDTIFNQGSHDEGRKLYDASHYYSDIENGEVEYWGKDPFKLKHSGVTFVDYDGGSPVHKETRPYAYEDTEGTIYITDGRVSVSKTDIFKGKKIKYVYEVSLTRDVVIRIALPNPQPIK